MKEREGWSGCPIEDEFLGEDRKIGKKERKLAKTKDRSKYKKTDQDKYLKGLEKDLASKLANQEWSEGRVLSIVPQGMLVESNKEIFCCGLKGILKRDKPHAKNLVAVGDLVLFEKTAPGEGIIVQIKPRFSFLSRADNLSRRKEQLIAVNIDQVIITLSVVSPPLKFPIIDRYIIAAHKGGMDPILVINKIDLLEEGHTAEEVLREQEQDLFEEAKLAYKAAGIPLIGISTFNQVGIDELKESMKGKTSVFSGPSGVGKSSLINLVTGLDLRVGDVVEKTHKGSHTTTTTQLIPLAFGGWCVDTPGIKSFGVWDLSAQEVNGYFPEIQEIGKHCKYADCRHDIEGDCAVIQALKEEKLSLMRYESYQALLNSLEDDHVRR